MSSDALIRAWFQEVWVKGDESAINRLMHPDAVVRGLSGDALRGPEAFKPYYRVMRDALGDINIVIERVVVEGDWCAALCHITAKHTGHALGGQPTNRPLKFHGITMTRSKDGQIVEGWNAFDFLTMYQQIGWLSNPVLPPG